jgi:hypothetical protein
LTRKSFLTFADPINEAVPSGKFCRLIPATVETDIISFKLLKLRCSKDSFGNL